ncbi:hypothetical protein PILCRDRAFT_812046 [Piloderma croceum F 1598]|uniref:Uncharacterized protein n=1 Tax=Piloderma croceum (strain F 1598) TaxID=765440 RepID=A0A0C3GF44_PILCF|nr:hypothetical protein PILCRDRAFT_812046 [Piloderma croceum F 1598]
MTLLTTKDQRPTQIRIKRTERKNRQALTRGTEHFPPPGERSRRGRNGMDGDGFKGSSWVIGICVCRRGADKYALGVRSSVWVDIE